MFSRILIWVLLINSHEIIFGTNTHTRARSFLFLCTRLERLLWSTYLDVYKRQVLQLVVGLCTLYVAKEERLQNYHYYIYNKFLSTQKLTL